MSKYLRISHNMPQYLIVSHNMSKYLRISHNMSQYLTILLTVSQYSTTIQPAFSLTSGLYCKRKSMVWKTFLAEELMMRRVLGLLKIIKNGILILETCWIDFFAQRPHVLTLKSIKLHDLN